MSEQRIKILEMLAESKITVEEAQALLESVSDPAAGASGQSSGQEHLGRSFDPYEGIEDEKQTQGRLVIDLSKVKLSGTVLIGAVLTGAKLDGANLSGTVLKGANLENADLRDADLSGAVLTQANFKDADLREANLSGTVMPGADFEGVHHPGLELSGVVLPAGLRFRNNKLEGPIEGVVADEIVDVGMVDEQGGETLMAAQEDRMTIAKAKPEPSPRPPAP